MIPRFRVAGVGLLFIILATSLFHFRYYVQDLYFNHVKAASGVQAEDLHGTIVTSPPNPSPPSACPKRLDWLHELAGSPDIKFPLRYARRDIVVRPRPGLERASVTKMDENLLPGFQEISSPDGCELGKQDPMTPLHLDVPVFSKHIDASHVLFGAATTLDRLDASIQFFERWLAHTGARLFIIVTGNEDAAPEPKRMNELQVRMRELGMLVTLVKPLRAEDRDIERYFSLIRVLKNNRDENTKWFGFIDDDTFFTSISLLVSRLGEFDHQKKWYLGAVSEDWWTVVHYGWIAMGGGGIFLSSPMIDTLDKDFENCKESAKTIFGDHRISECINKTTDSRLTQLDGLYQIDLHGDRSGVFESGRQMISQHHWKEGYWSEDGSGADAIRHSRWFPMDKMSYASDVCGDTCFLQRFQFGNDTLLTNGYSIAVYPKANLNDLPLFQMERTWVTPEVVVDSLNDGYDHYLGPLRPALKLDKEKVHYRFMDAKLTEGGVRQYYRHLGKNGDLDSLVELRWTVESGLNSSSGLKPRSNGFAP